MVDCLDEAVDEFRRGMALCERQGWYVGFAYLELLVGLGAMFAAAAPFGLGYAPFLSLNRGLRKRLEARRSAPACR